MHNLHPNRAKALAALASMQALPAHAQKAMISLKPAINQRVLTKMLLAFFESSLYSNDGVPNFTLDDFTVALGASLLQMGNNNHKGTALLQTLVHELQDNINNQLQGK